jgi:hypothetical protein
MNRIIFIVEIHELYIIWASVTQSNTLHHVIMDATCMPLYNTLTITHPAFQDWLHDVSVDVKGKGHTDRHWLLNVKAAATAVIVNSFCCGATWWWSNTHIMFNKWEDYQVKISWEWQRLSVEKCNKEGWSNLFVQSSFVFMVTNFNLFLADILCNMPHRGCHFNKNLLNACQQKSCIGKLLWNSWNTFISIDTTQVWH